MSTRTQDVQDSYNRVVDSSKDISDDMPRRQTWFRSGVQLMLSFMSGMVFGLAAEKSRVFEPHIIREQMLFTNFTMLKMFLSASAVGMLSFSFLSMIPATLDYFEFVQDDMIISLMTKSVTSAAVGGALLGCGMAVAGACPGMVFIQVGAGIPQALFTIVGGLCGAYLYALTEPLVSKYLQPRKPYRYFTLDEFLGSPYFIIALPLAATLGMVVCAVEVVRPWSLEVEQSGSGLVGSRAWPPFVGGMLIGLLQIPTVLSLRTTLGVLLGRSSCWGSLVCTSLWNVWFSEWGGAITLFAWRNTHDLWSKIGGWLLKRSWPVRHGAPDVAVTGCGALHVCWRDFCGRHYETRAECGDVMRLPPLPASTRTGGVSAH